MADINNQGAVIAQQNINSTVYNYYYKKEIRKILASPFFSEIFLGRQEEVQHIYRHLHTGENVLLLNGEAGIGKTALAAQYYLLHQHDYHHLAWVLAERGLVDAVLTLALALEINFPDTMPAKERFAMLLDVIRNLQSPCLLVIDYVNQLSDLENHYKALRSCPNCHILLTTRITEFEQAATYKIESLPADTALELFKKYYPKHQRAEDEIFAQINLAVGGNTLVLEILAKNLQLFNRLKTTSTLAALLADLQAKGLLALSQTKTIGTWYHSKDALRKSTPAAIIEAMYDLGELNDPEKKLLSVFAVLPGENIEFTILDDLLKDKKDTADILLNLFQKGWLDYNEAVNSFTISPLVQEITLHKNPNIYADCKSLIDGLLYKLAYEPDLGHLINSGYKEAARYARYATSVVNNVEAVDTNLSILYERLGNYHSTTGNLPKALQFQDACQRMRTTLFDNAADNPALKNSLAIAYARLGELYIRLGNLQKALHFFDLHNKFKKELLDASPGDLSLKKGLAIAYQQLGNTHSSLGHPPLQVLDYFEKSAQLSRELCEASPDNTAYKDTLAVAYQDIGVLYADLGDLRRSLDYFTLFNTLEKELYENWPASVNFKNSLGISYQYLGDTHTTLGHLQQALDFYTLYNNLEKELYEAWPENVEFKSGLAVSYSKIADTYAALGRLPEALAFFEQDARLSTELYAAAPENAEFKNGLAITYQYLGNTHADLGNTAEALHFYSLYNQFENELATAWPDNIDYKSSLAISCQYLGNIHTTLGNTLKAAEYYTSFNRLEIELCETSPGNVDFKDALAISYQYLGKTKAAQGNQQDALDFYMQYNRLEKELYEAWPDNTQFKKQLAISYNKLGSATEQNPDASISNNYFQSAKELFSALVHDFPNSPAYKKHLDWVENKLK